MPWDVINGIIGICRDDSQIRGCVGGVTAYTPPNLVTSTAIPKEPINVHSLPKKKRGREMSGLSSRWFEYDYGAAVKLKAS